MIALLSQHHRGESDAAFGGAQSGAASSPLFVIAVVAAAVVLAIAGRLVTHKLDSDRIRRYAESQGWQLLDAKWTLFGPGWFGGGKARLYSIRYTDREGRTRSAYAKTSALAGVYLTEDRAASDDAA